MDQIDWMKILEYGMQLITAYVLALPIGWDQEKEHQSAGLRVFPIVAVGSCGYLLLAYQIPTPDNQAHTRILVGLISGIGFIGGGAIIKHSSGENVRGIATAASIWVTGAIGAAVAWHQFALAILLSTLIIISHKVMRPARKMVHAGNEAAEGEKGVNEEKENNEQSHGESSGDGQPQQRSPATGRGNQRARNGDHNVKRNAKPSGMSGTMVPADAARASIMGVLVACKDIDLQGLSHRVVVIRDDRNTEYLVDLGSPNRFNEFELERGMYMMVHGRFARVGNRQGLRASQIQFNGGIINIGAGAAVNTKSNTSESQGHASTS